MRSIADQIEKYLKELLARSSKGEIEVQRSELAQAFACVPSQINYVLNTRFSAEQGYLVESRRGGGGYVKIVKLPLDQEKELRLLINEINNALVSQRVAEGLINRLQDEGFLTKRESLLMKTIIQRETLGLELPERDIVRGRILKALMVTLLRGDFRQNCGR